MSSEEEAVAAAATTELKGTAAVVAELKGAEVKIRPVSMYGGSAAAAARAAGLFASCHRTATLGCRRATTLTIAGLAWCHKCRHMPAAMAQEGHNTGVEHPRASVEELVFDLDFEFGGSLSIRSIRLHATWRWPPRSQYLQGHVHGECPQLVRDKMEQQAILRSIPATQQQQGADAEGLQEDE